MVAQIFFTRMSKHSHACSRFLNNRYFGATQHYSPTEVFGDYPNNGFEGDQLFRNKYIELIKIIK